jgi:putative transcriptional regulator
MMVVSHVKGSSGGLRILPALWAIAWVLRFLLAATQGESEQAPPTRPNVGSLAGQLLVATDELKDPRFVRTVIYMVHHDRGGAMGIVVNRPIGNTSLAALLEGLGIEGNGAKGGIRLHYGGPVEPRRGFVLHTTDYASESTRVVKDGIALTVGAEILRTLGTGTGPRLSLVAFGYAGWAPGQLESEIAAGAWVVVQSDEALIFDQDYEKKWDRAMARRTIQL